MTQTDTHASTWEGSGIAQIRACRQSGQSTHYLFTTEMSLLLLLTIASVGHGASHCVADCSTVQHLYQQVCCQASNLGRTTLLKENGRVKIIVCPSVLQSCPGIVNFIM